MISLISFQDASVWLNREDRSRVSVGTNFWINKVADLNKPAHPAFKDIKNNLQRLPMTDPLEYPEALMILAKRFMEQDWHLEAIDYLNDASNLYRTAKQEHRQATALWMLSIAERKANNDSRAHAHASQARKLFDGLRKYRVERRYQNSVAHSLADEVADNQTRITWYLDKLHLMSLELTSMPEEPYYEWLNQFSGSAFSAVSLQLAADVQDAIHREDYRSVEHLLDELLQSTRQTSPAEEEANAIAFSALIHYEFNHLYQATDLLQDAIAQYTFGSHPKAVMRWMLGMMSYGLTKDNREASVSCQKAIEEMEALARQADQNNQQPKKEWYQVRVGWMKEVLIKLMDQRKNSATTAVVVR